MTPDQVDELLESIRQRKGDVGEHIRTVFDLLHKYQTELNDWMELAKRATRLADSFRTQLQEHGYYECVPKKDMRQLEVQNMNMWDIILQLKRGSCWCEMGIGNPMVRDHSPACKQVQEMLKSVFPANLAERIWSPQL